MITAFKFGILNLTKQKQKHFNKLYLILTKQITALLTQCRQCIKGKLVFYQTAIT